MLAKMLMLSLALWVMALLFGAASYGALPGEEPKGPVVLHRESPNVLDTTFAGLTGSEWRQIAICHNLYKVLQGMDDGNGKISLGDYLRMTLEEAFGSAPPAHADTDWYYIYRRVTITQVLRDTSNNDTMYVEFTGGIQADSMARAINNPVCTWWRQFWGDYGTYYHIDEISPSAPLAPGKYVRLGTEWWFVEDVALDIEVERRNPDAPVPTTSEWGLIILVALLIVSAIFIWVRKRKVVLSA
jgi:hypothetical protein